MSMHYTVLNADVTNCYITLLLLVGLSDCLLLHHQFDRIKASNDLIILWFKYSMLEYSKLKVINCG